MLDRRHLGGIAAEGGGVGGILQVAMGRRDGDPAQIAPDEGDSLVRPRRKDPEAGRGAGMKPCSLDVDRACYGPL
jgi:hypothetical protein